MKKIRQWANEDQKPTKTSLQTPETNYITPAISISASGPQTRGAFGGTILRQGTVLSENVLYRLAEKVPTATAEKYMYTGTLQFPAVYAV